MNATNEVEISTADPSAMGLFGLAIVTFVASTQKLGWTDGLGLVIPRAIFLGGIAQFYASILESKHNNTFGMTALGAYGLFWMGVGMTWFVQAGVFDVTLQASAETNQLGVVYLGYLIFTLLMTIGVAETNKVLLAILVMIGFLFIGLALSSFGIMEHGMNLLAAYSEFIIALLSLYGAGANVLNKHLNFTFLPIGRPFGIFTKKLSEKNQQQLKLNRKGQYLKYELLVLPFPKIKFLISHLQR